MNQFKIKMATLTVAIFVSACSGNTPEKSFSTTTPEMEETVYWVDSISELTDEQYPDNPDISIRSKLDGTFSHSKIKIERKGENFTLSILPKNGESDTILLSDIDLLKFIPSVPTYAKEDEYLTAIGVINQEWNRMQVNFTEGQFAIAGTNLESQTISRVDLARNCINAYLWELIFYTNENGNNKPVYHGWFNFPKGLYGDLFEQKNELNYADFAPALEEWITPPSNKVDLNNLRNVIETKEAKFTNLDNQYYPEVGERKKKKMNIMFPKNIHNINDFLTDSTVYATFSAPGCYNQADPRKTHLAKLKQLKNIEVSSISSNNSAHDTLTEIVLHFENENDTTDFVIGGIDVSVIPVLTIENAKNGYQMPMGIGNYSFYTNYADLLKTNHLESPYYSFLLDENGKWLDSHDIGIDGPLMHFDENGSLHLWILSFERHSFVGHYVLKL